MKHGLNSKSSAGTSICQAISIFEVKKETTLLRSKIAQGTIRQREAKTQDEKDG